MNSLLVAVVLTSGSCGFGSTGASADFVNDVRSVRLSATTACHKAEVGIESLDIILTSNQFEMAFAPSCPAADSSGRRTDAVAKGSQRRVAVALRCITEAAESTFIQPRARLINAAQPLVARLIQSVFMPHGATSGVLWDDHKLLDEISRIA